MRKVPRNTCAAIAIAALLASAAFAEAPGDDARLARYEWTGPSNDALRRMGAILRAARIGGRDAEPLIRQLAEPGLAAIDPMIDVLAQGRVPKGKAEDAPQALSEAQRSLLLSALARLKAASVRSSIEKRLSQKSVPDGTRLAGLYVYGVVGGADDVARLAAIAPRRSDKSLDDEPRDALRGAFSAILRRDPLALRAVREELRKGDAAVGREALFALTEIHDPRVARVCYDVARSDPRLAQQALSLLRQVGRSDDADVDKDFAHWLATKVDPARPEWTRAVLLAMGSIDEGECIALLVDLLDHSNLGIRESAHTSLRRISGRTFPADPAAWKTWFEREKRWMEDERANALAALQEDEPSKVVDALRAYSDRRLFQSELAADVARVLSREEPGLRMLACETLGRLGSSVAIEALKTQLADPDLSVQTAARAALTTLLGRDPDGLSASKIPAR